jgi:peptidoglycan hydrolase-like protein with peptidoglycan-binding domain
MAMIRASVGLGGVNDGNDTRIVQCALNVFRSRRGQGSLSIDGIVGPLTIGAIRDYQLASRLPLDGRIDPNGPTIARLAADIGGEAAIFGPLLRQLYDIQDQLRFLSVASTDEVKRFIDGMVGDLNHLRDFSDLATAPDGRPEILPTGFGRGALVIGFVGADDLTVAIIAIAFFLAIMLIIMVRSPEFRSAVESRARELDRIFSNLGVSMQVKFDEAVQILESVFNESIDSSEKCRNSPPSIRRPNASRRSRRFVERRRKFARPSRMSNFLSTCSTGVGAADESICAACVSKSRIF